MIFNIRAGNTLVGFTSLEAVRQAMTIRPDGHYRMVMPEDEAALKRINEDAEMADKAFQRFREQQTEHDMEPERNATAKTELQSRLSKLRNELDRHLATEYGIDLRKPTDFQKWHSSHQPFHWFVEFYHVMKDGGFDVVIGNPPYVEYSQIRDVYTIQNSQFTTAQTGNLYAFMFERAQQLVKEKGFSGLIVPISSISTPRMEGFVEAMKGMTADAWISNYAVRPSKLFVGVDMNLTIVISRVTKTGKHGLEYTTTYHRWSPEYRDVLFKNISMSVYPMTQDYSNSLYPSFVLILSGKS